MCCKVRRSGCLLLFGQQHSLWRTLQHNVYNTKYPFCPEFFADQVSILSTQRKRRGFCGLTHKHGTHTPYMECPQGTLFQTILFSHVGEIWTSELPWFNALILICVIFWICIFSMVNCLFNFGRYFRCANLVHKYIL